MPDIRAQCCPGAAEGANLPDDVSEFQAYGLWDGLNAYDSLGRLRTTIRAHPGFLFPESPSHYVEALRRAVRSGQGEEYRYWPVRADVDITQHCTNKCYFCYARLYARDPLYLGAEMPFQAFEAIAADLAQGGTSTIRFTGGGEPLLHPEFKRMVEVPGRYGLRSCLITNGTLLDAELDRLLVAHLDHVRVSINAATNSTWERIQSPDPSVNRLPDILAHVEHMARLRETMWPGERRPLIWITYLLVPENAREVLMAAHAARDSGADSISFRSVYHELYHSWTDSDYETLREQLARAAELHAPPTFQVFTPKTALEEVWRRNPHGAFARCYKCRLITIVEATHGGALVKLCDVHRGMYGDEIGSPGKSLGLVAGATRFRDVWQSGEAQAMRADRPAACGRHCIVFSLNQMLCQVWQLLVEDPEMVFHRRCARPEGYHPLPPRGAH